MTSKSFFMMLLVSFVCSTIVAAAPIINSTSHSPFNSTDNSSTNVFNNHESDYLQWSNSTITVKYEPTTLNDSATFLDKPHVLNATTNHSAALLNQPSIFNVTSNGWETTTNIVIAAKSNTYGPEVNSTLITVTPNLESKPVEMGSTKNITNSTYNNSIIKDCLATYELKTNLTNTDSTHKTDLNCTINCFVDVAQHLNSTSDSSNNSMLFTTHSELKPEVSNSTETITSTSFTVAERNDGLQLGSEEIPTYDTASVISKRSVGRECQYVIPGNIKTIRCIPRFPFIV
ncbi:Hypothetical protein CINCED_3A020757 [Cinara cedri]|uniref:Uncharacterized protein n=1 Tax=Cinara cedri TaxID=506608 RepID=A0A5E4NN08_9HEMI|nr:Hypothetical protein CINCED_3A020757 [Cinara cedri]